MSVRHCLPLIMGLCLWNSAIADNARYPDFDGKYQTGKPLWLENCEGCHGYGIAGAPVPMRSADWVSRVTKDTNELYANAINGFFGPGDTYMPARGGNSNLTDEEVQLAVDYMLALASHYIAIKEEASK